MKKICTKCRIEKPIESFNSRVIFLKKLQIYKNMGSSACKLCNNSRYKVLRSEWSKTRAITGPRLNLNRGAKVNL